SNVETATQGCREIRSCSRRSRLPMGRVASCQLPVKKKPTLPATGNWQLETVFNLIGPSQALRDEGPIKRAERLQALCPELRDVRYRGSRAAGGRGDGDADRGAGAVALAAGEPAAGGEPADRRPRAGSRPDRHRPAGAADRAYHLHRDGRA